MVKPPSRSYDSPRRREQAAQTRARIAEAARALFLTHGWSATTVRDVAREAGVAEPTVYAVYGSKAGLAMALVDAVDTAADVPRVIAELGASEGDPAGQIAAMVGFDRRLFERGGDAIALLSEARRAEPDLRAAYDAGRRRGDEVRRRIIASWPAGTLGDGLDVDTAVDACAALLNVEVYRLLRDERGWSADRIERWWCDALARLLLR